MLLNVSSMICSKSSSNWSLIFTKFLLNCRGDLKYKQSPYGSYKDYECGRQIEDLLELSLSALFRLRVNPSKRRLRALRQTSFQQLTQHRDVVYSYLYTSQQPHHTQYDQSSKFERLVCYSCSLIKQLCKLSWSLITVFLFILNSLSLMNVKRKHFPDRVFWRIHRSLRSNHN